MHYYFRKLLIFAILSSSIFLYGVTSQYYFSGYIYNSSGIPLEGANIVLTDSKGVKTGLSSDQDGFFKIFFPEKGYYTIKITFIGYNNYSKYLYIDNKNYNETINLEVKSITLDELEIINSSKRSLEVGASTIVGSKRIQLIKPTGTQEILESIPGINGFSDDGIGNSRINIGIRGLNPRRTSRVLILEDGVPIQPALYVYPNMYYNPPSERISEVEVVKGGGSVLYGPQTMGGVVNYLTKRPGSDSYFDIKLTAGNNGLYSSFFEIGNLFGSKFNPNFQFLYKQGDGFRENNSFQQFNITFKSNYIKSKDETFYFKLNFNDEYSNATYTGLTQYSFEQELEKKGSGVKTYNPKDFDNFDILRFSADLIHMCVCGWTEGALVERGRWIAGHTNIKSVLCWQSRSRNG